MEKSAEAAAARYELSLSEDESRRGVTKILVRNAKRLEVVVPPGVNTGSVVKLSNAMRVTDGREGDILIQIRVKTKAPVQDQTPAGVIEITDADFDREVLESDLPVVVDFWAPWCGPCRMMAPVMEETAARYQGRFKFCKINVDENPQSAARYRAMSIPLLIFFRDGQAIDQNLGAIPASQLRNKLDSLL